jgi:lipoprotein|nr:MAG TPA: hypothetical protein [Caudoviricetes sp.]
MLDFIKNADFLDIFCGLLILGAACYIICAIVYATFLIITEGLYLRHKQKERLKYENERDYLEIGRDPVKERLLSEYIGKVKVPYPSQQLKDLAIQITRKRIQLGKARLAVKELERSILKDAQKYAEFELWLAARLNEEDYIG